MDDDELERLQEARLRLGALKAEGDQVKAEGDGIWTQLEEFSAEGPLPVTDEQRSSLLQKVNMYEQIAAKYEQLGRGDDARQARANAERLRKMFDLADERP